VRLSTVGSQSLGGCHAKPASPVFGPHLIPPVKTPLKSHFPARINLLTFLICGWLGLVMSLAHAAPDATTTVHISEIQKAVLNELNVARTTPMKYVEYLKDRRRGFKGKIFSAPGGIRVTTREGVAAVDEAIEALSKQAPLAALQFSEGLALAALDHVLDTGPKGLVSHDGSDDSNPVTRVSRYGELEQVSGECISFGHSEARQIVLTLIIDDGVPSRGHRLSIYKQEFRLAGIARGPHKTYKDMCVIDFACVFKEDKLAIRKRLAK